MIFLFKNYVKIYTITLYSPVVLIADFHITGLNVHVTFISRFLMLIPFRPERLSF
jgi:hypothetical protein